MIVFIKFFYDTSWHLLFFRCSHSTQNDNQPSYFRQGPILTLDFVYFTRAAIEFCKLKISKRHSQELVSKDIKKNLVTKERASDALWAYGREAILISGFFKQIRRELRVHQSLSLSEKVNLEACSSGIVDNTLKYSCLTPMSHISLWFNAVMYWQH